METKSLNPRKSLNKAFLKLKPNRTDIEIFKSNLIELIDRSNPNESEEFHKNLVASFLNRTYYHPNFFLNTKGRNDLVIYNGKDSKSTVGVIIEAKKTSNKSEMLSLDNINVKAFHEMILYYLRERVSEKNLEIKHIIATNINEWFIFEANVFEKLFANNKILVKQFTDFEEGRLSGKSTDFFYSEIAKPFVENIKSEIVFTYFDLRVYEKPLRNDDKIDDTKLIALFKLFSPEHLLKLPFSNDSNSLDKRFYSELLHIIGLTETKQGSKKLIERKPENARDEGSLLENAINQLDALDKISRLDNPKQFGATMHEQLFAVGLELTITWINRILFLKLLEAQLTKYHKGDKAYSFLNFEKIRNYDDLNTLFFQVLARKHLDRSSKLNVEFSHVPFLNSSLFEPTEIEHSTLLISNLADDEKIPIIPTTVLKDNTGKKRTGELTTLEYLFEFLDSYDFSSEGAEDIQEDNKTLINASVLGLIFEKINGYKDGSFFTPGFITMYMCRETIRKAVIQKFNEAKNWNCTDIDSLYDKIDNRNEANKIINSIKICDPAVGSGHFLVSALNEIIAIKSDLKILQDRDGKRLKEYHFEVVNDELIVTDEDGELFEYNPTNKESQRIQETLFHEKQTIIENCLFGVDINPNSVKICRLRLWIELLKNAFYKNETELETLPNIDINIKCGNSLISRFALNSDLKQALRKSKWSIDSYRMAVANYRNAKSKEVKHEMEKLILKIKQDFSSEIRNNDPLKTRHDKLANELYNRFTGNFLFDPGEQYGKKGKEIERKRKSEQAKLEKEIAEISSKIEEIKQNVVFENSFEWRFEFPEVLNDSGDFIGFDVVIGNPPYGVILDRATINILKNNYPYGNSGILQDSYINFIVLGLCLGTSDSILSYIIPNTWRLINIAHDFRKDSLSKFGLYKIDSYLQPVFDEAVVDCDIVFYDKKVKEKILLNINDADKQLKSNQISVETLIVQNTINSHLTENQYNLIQKLKAGTKPLKDIMSIKNGVKPYEVGKGNPKQTKVTITEKPYTKNTKADDTFVPLIGGSDFHRYSIKWNNDNYISYGPWLAAPRDSGIFEKKEKIIVRQTSDKLIATLIENGFVMRNNTHILLSEKSTYKIKFILALINSKLFDFIYWTINPEKGEALAEVKAMHLGQLPIMLADNRTQEQIETLVNEILAKKVKDHSADTIILENQIDQLVYELYGLSDEEIELIEKSVK